MRKNIGKNISKILSNKYSQKHFDHAKQPATAAFKTAPKKAIQETDEASGDLIDNKIADQITKVSRRSPQNGSKTVESETENTGFNKKIPKVKYISPERAQCQSRCYKTFNKTSVSILEWSHNQIFTQFFS